LASRQRINPRAHIASKLLPTGVEVLDRPPRFLPFLTAVCMWVFLAGPIIATFPSSLLGVLEDPPILKPALMRASASENPCFAKWLNI
jgi:hypothetical protein